ncbi:FAD-binding oxidoreductase [Nitrosospira sp. NpAV]|uniref:FAD-binding oxidoreductase n=1 Tax=Nitrosospira sp. NpAV TaxID=58133 RepID=UPI0005A15E67|nr:FAD-linked oxidase C-terminal domain-containing protein [Nitrosospira sp. NpAV]KIO48016.1 dimethylmenaquinone methyltransferase [Nitrosospira sp. NpAV]
MLPVDFIVQLRNLLPSDRLLTDPVDCYTYAYDNSRKIFPPAAVAFPVTAEEVQAIVALCNDHCVPLTPRGRGTGTSGGSLPEQGGVALSLERMLRVISVDPANRVIVAEPGVLNQSIQEAAKPHGFFWPPDPSSAAYSSIGGNLATSAGGPHAVKYGTTRDHVLGLRAVTGAGKFIKTGCYTTKGVVGYDLTRLLVGSEGTLAVITEATLKLTPLPQARSGLTAHYRDARSCASAIVRIMALPETPSALEFLDAGALNLIRGRFPDMVPADTGAMLMIEVDGPSRYISALSASIREACRNTGLILVEEVADAATLWLARKTLSPLLRDIAPKKINEDIVVPVSALPEFLEELAQLTSRYGIANVNFGHAGNGNIHVNLLVNPDAGDEMSRAEKCLNEMFDLVIRLNGTLSGEHGVGSEKRAYVSKEIDSTTLVLMKDIKRVFDPRNILNPGKLFPG